MYYTIKKGSFMYVCRDTHWCWHKLCVFYLTWTHIYTNRFATHKPLWVGACQLCHPLTPHSDGGDKSPVCLIHSPPEQRRCSVTDMEHSRTVPPLLRAFNISVIVSDGEILKGAEGVCWRWKHDRLRQKVVPYVGQLNTGHYNLLWIRFYLFIVTFFCLSGFSPLCPFLLCPFFNRSVNESLRNPFTTCCLITQ